MIGRLLALGTIAAYIAAAQHSVTRAWFPDGAGVDVFTETTGSTQEMSVPGGGAIRYDRVSRIVQDSQNRTIFSYELEAKMVPNSDAIAIRIKPASGGGPTVSGTREFQVLKKGQEVKIEILSNPATGERVYDVLRPAEGPSPRPGRNSVEVVEIPAVGAVSMVVNGHAVAVKSTWVVGKPARLYLPGHGVYFLSWESRPKFRLAGYIEKNRLIFLMDSQYVEMIFPGNVLTTAEGGPVWLYHDPKVNPGGATCLLDSYRSF